MEEVLAGLVEIVLNVEVLGLEGILNGEALARKALIEENRADLEEILNAEVQEDSAKVQCRNG